MNNESETNDKPSINSSEQPNITMSLMSQKRQVNEVLLTQNKREELDAKTKC